MKSHRGRHIFRLALAHTAFSQAVELTAYLRTSRLIPQDDIYAGMLAGICISYARPFGSNEEVGTLSSEFSTFTKSPKPSEYQAVHNRLLEMRNKLFGHRDMAQVVKIAEKIGVAEKFARVELHIESGQYVGFQMKDLSVQIDDLDTYGEFLLFQKYRVGDAIAASAQALLKGHEVFADGFYRIRDDKLVRVEQPM